VGTRARVKARVHQCGGSFGVIPGGPNVVNGRRGMWHPTVRKLVVCAYHLTVDREGLMLLRGRVL
jgi:hypothetical protein